MSLINDCVFCKIIRSELPCVRLYEDDLVLAFLDIAPFNLGHSLVIPKQHHHSITTLPEDCQGRLMAVASKLAAATLRSLKADAFNLLLNNGSCAGQEVPHVHLHVIPRFLDDHPIFNPAKQQYKDQAQMQETADKIRTKLGE
ncbi:MAG: HIT family protein [Lentisphaeria bacterium]|jgi:histidine triad (HIT) family protein|nr:HIT family protein [Lentisphaeria bacterium]MDY0176145.1 HIT family protein [Lentisphaeria bacterium]NLZ59699.1 HIT family protein [Lentisphaerota bacterium]